MSVEILYALFDIGNGNQKKQSICPTTWEQGNKLLGTSCPRERVVRGNRLSGNGLSGNELSSGTSRPREQVVRRNELSSHLLPHIKREGPFRFSVALCVHDMRQQNDILLIQQ